MLLKVKKLVLTRDKTLDFLENLSTEPVNAYQTIYLPPHLQTAELERSIKELPSSTDISDELVDIYIRSSTGAAIFWSVTNKKYLVVPPFQIIEQRVIPTLDTKWLHSMLNKDYYIGVVLVRLGAYAIGICHGDKLVSIKAGTGLIHRRHRQGGSSAHRFERHRDKQIESFLIRICGHVREQLGPYVKSLDYIVYGGARTTILSLQKYCPLLGKIDKPILPSLLDIPEPRRSVLETAVSRIWSSTIYIWTED